jgi:hypothetical protein
MCAKLELERINLEREKMKFEKERNDKDCRFRCVEYASRNNTDHEIIISDAKKYLEFIEGK